jgi:thiol-disulfide isomerase/thioredoxin
MRSISKGALSIVWFASILSVHAGQIAEPGENQVKQQLARLVEEYNRLDNQWFKSIPKDALRYSEDISDEEWVKTSRNERPPHSARLLPQILALAENYPNSPSALGALSFLVRQGTATIDVQGAAWQAKEQALDFVLKRHLNDPRVIEIFGRLSVSLPSAKAESLLRTAMAECPDQAMRASACMSLARYLETQGRNHKQLRALKDKSRLTNVERGYKLFAGPYLEYKCPYDRDKTNAEIERLLARIIDEYPDARPATGEGTRTYAEKARAMLFELKHLRPGKTAPDIEGRDADGTKFRLSDYQGKVILLTFSANWCPPCHELYPLERELAAKFKDEAFALLSVTMDERVDTLKSSLASGEITWRCWWDGVDGPIPRHGTFMVRPSFSFSTIGASFKMSSSVELRRARSLKAPSPAFCRSVA